MNSAASYQPSTTSGTPPPACQKDGHGYLCPVTQDMPGVITTFFETAAGRILTPEIGLAPHLVTVTWQEVASVGARLGIRAEQSRESWAVAVAHQAAFERSYREAIADDLRTG